MHPTQWTICDIGALARAASWIGRGWFSVVALLYIEGLILLLALVDGAVFSPLLGAALLAAQLPPVLKGARIFLRAALPYRLAAIALAFMAVISADPTIDITARMSFVLILIVPTGLVVFATLTTTPVSRTYRDLEDGRVFEYCLFGDRGRRGWLHGLWTPRLRPAAPWFAAAVILAGAGIALSIAMDRGVAVLFMIPAAFLVHRGRRHMAPRAKEARHVDHRRPILILRAFQDDRIKMGKFSFTPRRTFEQVVAAEFKNQGPPIIVGEPGEQLPLLGALREYLASDDWQTAVSRLMDESALLAFVLGDTDNLLWEFQQAINQGRQTDVLVIAPPLKPRLLESRWRRFTEGIGGSLDHGIPGGLPGQAVLGVFFAGADPVCIRSRKRGLVDYRLGIRLFLHLHREGVPSRERLRETLERHLPMIQAVGHADHSPSTPITL